MAADPLNADLAPIEHIGYGISPVNANGLRMLSAHVDINWGSPCTLSANFVIDNQTARPVDIQLGFPIQKVHSERLSKGAPDELTFAFDGVPVLPASIAINDPTTEKLKSFRIEKLKAENWNDARLVQYLNDESKVLDPDHKGIKFVLRIPADKAEVPKVRDKLSFGMEGGSFPELLSLAGFKYSIEGETVYLQPSYFGDNISDPNVYTWYRCQHTFPPGHTTVSVTTEFPATLIYGWPYRERILYCIETGGSWEGSIGSEEVDIHFPGTVTPGQIYDTNPKNYTLDGDTVRWLFKDFKPQGKDHDIDIEYLRPDVVAAISKARTELARDPSDSKRIVKLAKDLFSLGPFKGAPYPTNQLSLKEFNDLLAQIKSDSDREWLKSFYQSNEKGEYDDNDQGFPDGILRILNSIDYQAPYQSPDVIEARAMIEKLLKDHPNNAEAWNVYFANYYRIRIDGGMGPFGGVDFHPHEIQQISKALHYCPNDPCLQLWFKVITGNYSDPTDGSHVQDMISLRELMKKLGFLDNDFVKISYD